MYTKEEWVPLQRTTPVGLHVAYYNAVVTRTVEEGIGKASAS